MEVQSCIKDIGTCGTDLDGNPVRSLKIGAKGAIRLLMTVFGLDAGGGVTER